MNKQVGDVSTVFEILGWYGVISILLAYALSNFKLLGVDSSVYLGLNITGSISIVSEALHKRDRPVVVLNAVWSGIALWGILKLVM